MIGFLLSSKRKKLSDCPNVPHTGLIISRRSYQRVRLRFPDLISIKSDPIYESTCDHTKTSIYLACTPEKTELISLVEMASEIQTNFMARSKRRTLNVHEEAPEKDLNDLEEPQEEENIEEEDIEQIFVEPTDDNRRISTFKSPVANAAKPFFTSEILIKVYQLMDLLKKFEKYSFQTRLDTALVRYSQSAALAKISKLLHIMYEVKRQKSLT